MFPSPPRPWCERWIDLAIGGTGRVIVGRNVFKDANIFSFWEPLYSFIFFVSEERGRGGGRGGRKDGECG